MPSHRQQRIMELLRKEKSLRIAQLAESCGVSQVTVRKDVHQLEQMGLLTKYHGEVEVANTNAMPYYYREEVNSQMKAAIARVAISLISNEDSIILDAGSTTTFIAREMKNMPATTIITNSVPIANELGPTGHIISLCGGEIFNRTMSLVGPDAERYFRKIRTNKLFLAMTGIRDDFTLTTGALRESGVKQAMIAAADEVILVADSSKFTNSSVFQFASGDQIHKIITTHPAPQSHILKQIEERGIELIYAD